MHERIAPDEVPNWNTYGPLFSSVLENEQAGIDIMRRGVQPNQIDQVLRILTDSRSNLVFTTGAGTSGVLARKVAHTFNCVGRPTVYLDAVDAVHGGSGVVTKGDVVFLFSRGGETAELRNLITPVRARGAICVAVTEVEESTIGRASDMVLLLPPIPEADEHGYLATTTILSAAALFDAIGVVLMRYNGYSPKDFLATHPGGAVGQRLQEEI